MRKKNKFVTVRYKLANLLPTPANFTYGSREEAMKELLEEVEAPMTLDEALEELTKLAYESGYIDSNSYLNATYISSKGERIQALKKYIVSLKT